MLCWEPASSRKQDSRPLEEWEDIYLICLFSLLKMREWFKSMSGVASLISTLKLHKRPFFFFVKNYHLHTQLGELRVYSSSLRKPCGSLEGHFIAQKLLFQCLGDLLKKIMQISYQVIIY